MQADVTVAFIAC